MPRPLGASNEIDVSEDDKAARPRAHTHAHPELNRLAHEVTSLSVAQSPWGG